MERMAILVSYFRGQFTTHARIVPRLFPRMELAIILIISRDLKIALFAVDSAYKDKNMSDDTSIKKMSECQMHFVKANGFWEIFGYLCHHALFPRKADSLLDDHVNL